MLGTIQDQLTQIMRLKTKLKKSKAENTILLKQTQNLKNQSNHLKSELLESEQSQKLIDKLLFQLKKSKQQQRELINENKFLKQQLTKKADKENNQQIITPQSNKQSEIKESARLFDTKETASFNNLTLRPNRRQNIAALLKKAKKLDRQFNQGAARSRSPSLSLSKNKFYRVGGASSVCSSHKSASIKSFVKKNLLGRNLTPLRDRRSQSVLLMRRTGL